MTAAPNASVDLDLVRRLCESAAAPGFEEAAGDIFASEAQKSGATIERDRLGTVYAHRQGPTKGNASIPIVMVDTHLDALSLVVRDVTRDGRVLINKLGYLHDMRTLPGRRVTIHADRDVMGVLAFDSTRPGYPEIESLWVDIGASNSDKIDRLGIRPGCPVTMHWSGDKFVELGRGAFAGFGLDYAVPSAIMLAVLEALSSSECPVDLWAVGHTQAEISSRGSGTAAHHVGPDCGFLMEIEHVRSEPYETREEVPQDFRKGPVLRRYQGLKGRNGFVSHSGMQRLLVDVAEEFAINYQDAVGEALPGGAFSRGSLLTTTGAGVPAVFIRTPIRYKHAPSEVCSVEDLDDSARLLLKALFRLGSGADDYL